MEQDSPTHPLLDWARQSPGRAPGVRDRVYRCRRSTVTVTPSAPRTT